MLDTAHYFVIIVNLLGNGVSFSPSSAGGGNYPSGVTVCDNVRLQALLLDSLGIPRVSLIYGYSMGAIQALHWGAMFPARVSRIAAVCGSGRASDYNVVFLELVQYTMRASLSIDPPIELAVACFASLMFQCDHRGLGISATPNDCKQT
eukprot:3592589-Amphidinium_carterae.1